jgi:hypothetical protein
MDCFRWARKEVGTAPFPKAKEYQKLKVWAYDQEEESEIDLYTTDDDSQDSEEEESSEDKEEESSEDEEEESSEDEEEENSEDEKKEPEEEFQEEFSNIESGKEESVSSKRNRCDDYAEDSE